MGQYIRNDFKKADDTAMRYEPWYCYEVLEWFYCMT